MRSKTSIEGKQPTNKWLKTDEQIFSLLRMIEHLQVKNESFYPEGLFPSQRFHTLLPYRREDNNIFFTALIVFTLQQAIPFLKGNSKTIAKSICSRAIETYPLYRSRRG